MSEESIIEETGKETTSGVNRRVEENTRWMRSMPKDVKMLLWVLATTPVKIHDIKKLYISEDYKIFSDVRFKGMPDVYRIFEIGEGLTYQYIHDPNGINYGVNIKDINYLFSEK